MSSKLIFLGAGVVGAFVVAGFAMGLFAGPPEQPGTVPNPVLATLVQKEIDAEIGRMNPTWSPGFLPGVQDRARAWLGEVTDVVARCRRGPGDRSKGNRVEYDVTLKDGTVIADVHSSMRCMYGFDTPLVMRVRFTGGKVYDVLTDGRERRQGVDASMSAVLDLADRLINLDIERRHHLYFPPSPTAKDIAREWDPASR